MVLGDYFLMLHPNLSPDMNHAMATVPEVYLPSEIEKHRK